MNLPKEPGMENALSVAEFVAIQLQVNPDALDAHDLDRRRVYILLRKKNELPSRLD